MSLSMAFQRLLFVLVVLILLMMTLPSHSWGQNPSLQADVKILPGLNLLKSNIEIQWPEDKPKKFILLLNKKLHITQVSSDDSVKLLKKAPLFSLYNEWLVELSEINQKLSLQYSGALYDPEFVSGSHIDSKGAQLKSDSAWLPFLDNYAYTLELKIQTPKNWVSITEAQQTEVTMHDNYKLSVWKSIYPRYNYSFFSGPYFTSQSQGFQIFTPWPIEQKPLIQNFTYTLTKSLAAKMDEWQKKLGYSPFEKTLIFNSSLPSFTENHVGAGIWLFTDNLDLNAHLSEAVVHKWALDNWFQWKDSAQVEMPEWAKQLYDYLQNETNSNEKVSPSLWSLLHTQLKQDNFNTILQNFWSEPDHFWNLNMFTEIVLQQRPDLLRWMQAWEQQWQTPQSPNLKILMPVKTPPVQQLSAFIKKKERGGIDGYLQDLF